jgi:hypothetical protein
MGDLLRRSGRALVRVAAVAWLMVVAPIELATTLAGLVSRPDAPPGTAGTALIVMRVLVTAIGLMVGRHLVYGNPAARTLALPWAAADVGTLGIVLASAVLPSNRAPGDGPVVWAAYAAAALVVVAASRLSTGFDHDH